MSSQRTIIPLLAVLAVSLGACAPESDGGRAASGEAVGNGDSSAGIFISGSSTVEPISARIADAFSKDNSDVAVRVEGPGTGDGFEMFCAGESDISDASRPIKTDEIEKCEAAGIDFVELKVAIDGLSAITSAQNQIECLSFADLYALLGPESTGFDTWADANDLAAELKSTLDSVKYGALHAPYPDAPLTVTAPGEESGTFDSFTEIVLADLAEEREQEATPRPDYQASPNDNVIVEGISGSSSSLGWVGYAFVQDNLAEVKALEVDGGKGCVAPTPETIASGEFPISRALYIYVNLKKAESNEQLAAFVDFYLSDAGLAQVPEVGYVSLPGEDIAKTREAWTERKAGAAAAA